jgi:hypothetical protein
MLTPYYSYDPNDPVDVVSGLAQHACQLILNPEVRNFEIALAERAARLECLRLLPDKIELFDMIYGSRFARLKEQWRDH